MTTEKKIATTTGVEGLRSTTPGTYGRGRTYTIDGKAYPSVTSIVSGGEPKPALVGWAKKVTAEYAVSKIDMLKTLVDDGDADGALRLVKGAAYAQRDEAAKVGSRLHEVAEARLLAQDIDLPDDPRVKALVAQIEDFLTKARIEWQAIEAVVGNDSIGYAGTLDGLGIVHGLPGVIERFGDDLPVVIDWKSGSGVYGSYAAQMAAYAGAEWMLTEEGKVPMPEVGGGLVVHVTPTGWQAIEVDVSETTLHYFERMRDLYEWAELGASDQAVRKPALAAGRTENGRALKVPTSKAVSKVPSLKRT